MSRETASRDVKLNVLTVLTGGLTAVAFVGAGLATGMAADNTAQKALVKAQAKAAAARDLAAAPPLAAPPLVATPLPVRSVVTTRFVQAKAPAAQASSKTVSLGTRGTRGTVAKRPTYSRPSRAGTSVRSTSRSAAAPVAARAPAPVAVRAPVVAPAPSAAS